MQIPTKYLPKLVIFYIIKVVVFEKSGEIMELREIRKIRKLIELRGKNKRNNEKK